MSTQLHISSRSSALESARALGEHMKAQLVGQYPRLFLAKAPSRRWERRLDDALIEELRLSYNDQDGLLATHLPPIGQMVESVGFSSLFKLSLLIVADSDPAGKMTLTLKRSGTLKIGPVYLEPRFRHRWHAVSAVKAVASVADEIGFKSMLATVPAGHGAAVTAARARMRAVARLRSHYRHGFDEMVFIRELSGVHHKDSLHVEPHAVAANRTALLHGFVNAFFHDVDERWDAWLDEVRVATADEAHRFIGKPHLVIGDGNEAALVIFKRGGTAKVIATSGGAKPSRSLLEQCVDHGRELNQRKLSLFWPHECDRTFNPGGQWQQEAQIHLGRNGTAVRIFSMFL